MGKQAEAKCESEILVLTIDEVSRLLRISRNLAYSLARQRRLPGVIHLGRKRMVVSRVVIERLLEEGEQVNADDR